MSITKSGYFMPGMLSKATIPGLILTHGECISQRQIPACGCLWSNLSALPDPPKKEEAVARALALFFSSRIPVPAKAVLPLGKRTGPTCHATPRDEALQICRVLFFLCRSFRKSSPFVSGGSLFATTRIPGAVKFLRPF